MNGGKPMMFDFSQLDVKERGYLASIHLHTDTVLHGNDHGLYLIQTNTKELPSTFCIPTDSKPPTLPAHETKTATVTMEGQISVHADFPQDECKNKNNLVYEVEPRYNRTMARLMKDIKTMDVALTFGVNGGTRNVALWAHRSVLEQEPGLARLLSKLKDVESSSTSSLADSGFQSYHVTEYSLGAYCSLIRFLYSGKMIIQVDLNDFAIGSPPNKPFSFDCKERPAVDGLFSSTASTDSDRTSGTEEASTLRHGQSTTFGELFQLADCYQVQDLREKCRAQIIESMNETNSISILFEYAYRFQDLKSAVLMYILGHLDKIYAEDKDPFDGYKDHPERFTLVTEILKAKFKTSA
ncbi:hypothetical protein BGZ81_004953 [Podila clonocystis]|nr:hypothetical protein BGZ81_004953 [Podila clonocystis]